MLEFSDHCIVGVLVVSKPILTLPDLECGGLRNCEAGGCTLVSTLGNWRVQGVVLNLDERAFLGEACARR